MDDSISQPPPPPASPPPLPGRDEDDGWVQRGLQDSSVAALLLVKIKSSSPSSIVVAGEKTCAAADDESGKSVIGIRWGQRMPRSKNMSRSNDSALMLKKDGDSTRGSPTTPLSWSGCGTSNSGGAGGVYNEGLVMGPTTDQRSNKAIRAGRSKKKKKITDLKEEETSLLRQRMQLSKELAALKTIVEEQRARNASLKRIKIELQSEPAKRQCTTEVPKETVSNQLRPMTGNEHLTMSQHPNSSEVQRDVADGERSFLLPDLNLPLEEEDLCGMS